MLAKQRCSVLEYTSSLSLLFFSHSPSSPSPLHPFSHLVPPRPPTCLTYIPHFTTFLSSVLSYCIIPLLFFPFICPSLSPRAPFYPTFLSSAGSQTAERLYTKAFCPSPHAAPSMTPAGCFPRHSATTRVHVYLRELAQPCIEYLAQSCT